MIHCDPYVFCGFLDLACCWLEVVCICMSEALLCVVWALERRVEIVIYRATSAVLNLHRVEVMLYHSG